MDYMNREQKLAQGNVKKLLLEFSVPAIIAMLVTAFYNIIDRIYIGKIKDVGHFALAGVGITFPIFIVIMAFSMLFGIGAAATISIRLGQKRREEAEKTLANTLVLIIITAIILTIVGLLFVDRLLLFFGATDNIFIHAKNYITVILLGTIFNMLGFGMNHTIRAGGNPMRAAMTMLIGAGLNIVLDPLFIFVFGWGVTGAAIATVISQIVSAIWVLSYFFGGKSNLKLRVAYLKLELPIIKSIVAIGMSPFSMQLAASVVSIIANRSLREYGGEAAMGAMTVIGSISMLFLMPIFGINQGSQPIIGYNYGAKSYDRVKEALKYAAFGATAIVMLGFLVVQLMPGVLIRAFNNDPTLVNYGVRGMRIFLAMLPVVGFQIICANYFQSIGKPLVAMFLSLLRQVLLLIPLYLILPRFFNLTGIWLAGPIADFTASLITALFLLRELKKLHEAHEESVTLSNFEDTPAPTEA
jgi:putative MATE family efflux protein